MIQFRNATEEDFQLLANVYREDISPSIEHAEQFANDLLNKMKTILAFSGEHLLGSLSWDVRGGVEDGVTEITGRGIRPVLRRKGIATKLITSSMHEMTSFFQERSSRLRVIYLFMESNNIPARNLYKSMDFEEVIEINNFYPENNATIWIKRME